MNFLKAVSAVVKSMDSGPGCAVFVTWNKLHDPSFLFCKRRKMVQYPPGKVVAKIKWVNNIFG